MYLVYQLVLEIPLKGNTLLKISKILYNFSKVYNLKIIGPLRLPIKIKKFTLLKSPHVFKKHMEHFQKITNKIVLFFNLESKQEKFLIRILNLFSWSFLGISIKKIKIEKLNLYI